MIPKKSPVGRMMHALGSVHLAMVLLIGGIIAMAAGTVIESQSGLDTARSAIYWTVWFDLYLLLLAVNLIVAVINRIPIKRHQWAFVLTHFAIVMLLVGAWVTRTFGFEGQVVIPEGGAIETLYLATSEITVVDESDPERAEQSFAIPETVFLTGEILSAGDATTPTLEILEYLPYGLAHIELEEAAEGSAGVEVQILAVNGRIDTWLLASYPSFRERDVGPIGVEMLQFRKDADLQQRLMAFDSASSQVVIDPGDGLEEVVIEVPRQLDESFDLGNGTTARVLRFFTSARVTADGLEENDDGRPNPAARIELTRGAESEMQTIFSLFSDFNLRTGDASVPLASSLRLNVASNSEKPLISVLLGPAQELYLQTTSSSGRSAAQRVEVGETVVLHDVGVSFAITKSLAQALPKTVVVASNAATEDAAPAMRLRVSRGANEEDFWIPRGGYQRTVLDGATYRLAFTRARRDLPFSIHLDKFELENHPGSNRPAAYASHVTLSDRAGNVSDISTVISMNRPLDYMDYRLFQSGYQQGEGGVAYTTILSVSFDPGVSIVYVSFVLLILGVGWYMVGSGHRRRRQSDELIPHAAGFSDQIDALIQGSDSSDSGQRETASLRTRGGSRGTVTYLLLIASLCFSGQHVEAQGVAPQALEATAGWAVQSKGRVKPLETHARELTLALTGRSSFDGLSALEIFWGYNLDGPHFRTKPYVRIDSKILKASLDIPEDQRRVSFDELMQNQAFQLLVGESVELEKNEALLSPLQEDALSAYAKLELVAGLLRGSSMKIIPGADPLAAWLTPEDVRTSDNPAQRAAYDSFVTLARTFGQSDTVGFELEATRLSGHLRTLSPGVYPSEQSIDVELFYNRLNAFGKAWVLYLVSFLLLCFFGLSKRRAGYRIGVMALIVGLILHTVGIGLRWNIAGRAPVSDMYESLVFMAWGVACFGVILELSYRRGYFGLAATLMGFLTLVFAEKLPIDSAVNPLVPVLANTSWLSIHVMTIMLSYSAFALAMAMGHVVLGIQLFRPGRTETLRTSSLLLYRTLQIGMLFLAAGICFGAIWANRSWGRYWGWDPKETWSLITFFAYLAVVHARFAGWIHHFGNAVWSILCFLCVVMTYYGVNFLLGTGMHSYGFSSGGTQFVIAYLVIEFAVVGAATWRYRSTMGNRTERSVQVGCYEASS